MSRTILRCPAVIQKCGRSRSALYLDIQQGLFPPPISLGLRAVGWPDDEVDRLNDARIAGKTKDEIRALVARLIAARKALA